MKLLSTNTQPLQAFPVEGEVVIFACGPRAVDAAFTPEAILASLETMRLAAEQALAQRVSAKSDS